MLIGAYQMRLRQTKEQKNTILQFTNVSLLSLILMWLKGLYYDEAQRPITIFVILANGERNGE